jgi:FkbM family methyltransferase
LIKPIANRAHDYLSKGPAWLAQAYINLISFVSRNLLPRSLGTRVHNSICGYIYGRQWQPMRFAARRVRMGKGTDVSFVPELSGFEAEALFCRQFHYEPALVGWLEDNVVAKYDLIIEIGANVGIYTVFLDALYRSASLPRDVAPRIVSFEPSEKAYRRLVANLAANGTSFVNTYQAAIGRSSGTQTFFEPTGHLTNGSFVRPFSELFSNEITESTVVTLAASELDYWLGRAGRRSLIKIDVEGFEPHLLEALRPLIEKYHPDIVIEVLPFTAQALNECDALSGYDRYLILMEGLSRRASFEGDKDHYDWLLCWSGQS